MRSTKLKTIFGASLGHRSRADPADLQRPGAAKPATPPMSFEEGVQTAIEQRLDYATGRDRLTMPPGSAHRRGCLAPRIGSGA